VATNTQVKLARRPVGKPNTSDFETTRSPLPEPQDGQVLIKVLCLSLDPAMRSWMDEGKLRAHRRGHRVLPRAALDALPRRELR
jgi:NADPH-dependent curcumin reductase CurA